MASDTKMELSFWERFTDGLGAFSEGLVGNGQFKGKVRGNGIVQDGNLPTNASVQDASSAYTAVLQALTLCNVSYAAGTRWSVFTAS